MGRDLIMILSGVIGGTLLIVIRNFIINRLKNKLQSGEDVTQEKFSLLKFISGMTTLKSGTAWAKDLHDIFNLRKLIIVGVILSVIFGYGFWKGQQSKPVQLVIDEASSFTIPVPHSSLALYKAKNSTLLQWIDTDTGRVVSTVKVKDIPELAKKLKPYGFIFEPVAVVGGSVGKDSGFEGGVGVSWFKWFKTKLDSFITSRGVYPAGISYSLTPNSGIGLGAGIGYKGDKRVILYYRWRF